MSAFGVESERSWPWTSGEILPAQVAADGVGEPEVEDDVQGQVLGLVK